MSERLRLTGVVTVVLQVTKWHFLFLLTRCWMLVRSFSSRSVVAVLINVFMLLSFALTSR
jgi:hypothetical protein